MRKQKPLAQSFYRNRSKWYRRKRLLFASPAEMLLIKLMGGRVWVWDKLHVNGFPLTIVASRGAYFRREHVRREVRIGSRFVDFAVINKYYRRALEVDGRAYHSDILVQQERNEYFDKYGVNVLHIEASDLYKRPDDVRADVIHFLAK